MRVAYLVTIAIFVSFLLFLFAPIITPLTLRDLTNCYSEGNTKMENLLNLAKVERWTLRKICSNRKVIIHSFEFCIKTVEKKSSFPRFLIDFVNQQPELFFSRAKNLETIKAEHNQECQKMPSVLID